MATLAKIASLTGQAWAEDANGERRLLVVGDELNADEALKLDAGAQLDLDFGDNQLISFLGEQDVTPDQRSELMGESPRLIPLETREELLARPIQETDNQTSEGHGFIQLVGIGEIIEANGITPLTVARIQEALRPFGMTIPVKEVAENLFEEHGYIREMLPRDLAKGIKTQLAPGSGPKGIYNNLDIKDGKVSGTVTFDPEYIKPGDKVTITDKDGNPLTSTKGVPLVNHLLTPKDIEQGFKVDIPVTEGQTLVELKVTVTDPDGNTGSSTDSKIIDAVTPKITVELEDGSGPNGEYNADDTKDGYVSGTITFDKSTTKPGDRIKITDKNGKIIIDRPITQDDITNGITVDVMVPANQTQVELNVTVTDPAGNIGKGSDNKTVDNTPTTSVPTDDGVTVTLQPGSGPNGEYNDGDTNDGKVTGTIAFDPNITQPGDKITVTDKDGNPVKDTSGKVIENHVVTQGDIDNGIIVEVPITSGETEVELKVTVTDPAGNEKSTDTDSKPVDNITPQFTIKVEGEGSFNGEEPAKITNGKVEAVITLETGTVKKGDQLVVKDNDGDILIDRPVTQAEVDSGKVEVKLPVATGQEDISVTATITDPAGNSGDGDNSKIILNPKINIANAIVNDADKTIDISGSTSDVELGKSVSITITDQDNTTITVAGPVVIQADGSYSVDGTDISSLADGPLVIKAEATDHKGNTIDDTAQITTLPNLSNSEITLDTTNVDDTDGTISISGKTADVAPNTTVNITITDQNGNEVTTTATTDANGEYVVNTTDISGLTDGPLTIKAETKDRNGNDIDDTANDTLDYLESKVTVDNVTVDNTAKEVVIKGSTKDVPENEQVVITITDGEGNTATGTTTVDANGDYTSNEIDTSGLVDGDFTVEVKTTDNNSNEVTGADNGSTTGSTELDQLAGTLTVEFTDKPVVDAAVTKITGTTTDVAAGETVSLTFTDQNTNTVTTTAVVANDGTYTVTVDLRGLTDGTITVDAESTDRNGGAVSDNDTVVLDAIAANITIDSTNVDDTAGTIDISGSTTDVAEGTTVNITITDQEGNEVITTATTDANGEYVVNTTDISGLIDGPLDIKAETIDHNGNAIDATATDDLDHVLGDLTVDSVTVDDGNQTVDISGSTTDVHPGETVTITITDQDGNKVTSTTTVDNNGKYSAGNIDISNLVDGDFDIEVSSTDNNGNPVSGTGTGELDNTNDTITVSLDNVTSANETAVLVTGSTTDVVPGETVYLTFNDGTNTTTATATVAQDGSYQTTVDLSGLTDGNVSVEAKADGRNKPVTANDNANKDSTAPTLEITSTKTILASGEVDEITFTFSEKVAGFDVTDINVAGGTLSNFTSADNIIWTADFTADGSGNISIKVADNSYTDVVGNFGTGDDHAINAAPTITALDVNGNSAGHITVSEQGINNASDNSNIDHGTLRVTAPAGLKSIDIGGTAITLAELQALPGTPKTITIAGHGELTINSFTATAKINGKDTQWDIDYTFELQQSQTHDSGNPEELLQNIVLGVTAEDINGGSSIAGSGNLGVLVIDDVPEITLTGVELDEALVKEANLGASTTVDFSGAFESDFGADGAAATNSLVYELLVKNSVSGLTDTATGKAINLVLDNGEIKGMVADSSDVAFTISLESTTGKVTLNQIRALEHNDPLTPNDFVKINNGALDIKATVTDKDGDTASAQTNIGDRFIFQDDGPKVNFDSTEIVIDEAHLVNGSNPNVNQTKSSKVEFSGISFGADGVGNVQFTDTGAGSTVDELKAMGLKSNTQALQYVLSNEGHTLIAYRGAGRDEGDKIFTVEIVDIEGTPGYQFTLNGPLDHLNEDNNQLSNLNLGFNNILVTDGDGDSVTTRFNVKVKNDKPDTATPQNITTDEDVAITFNSNADATKANTKIGAAGAAGGQDPKYGTVTIEDNGQLTYTPNENYSGSDTFTYTTTTDSGEQTYTVVMTVNPVADTPELGADKTITTDEDVSKLLGLKVPVITDATQADATADFPERLGEITLSLTGTAIGTLTNDADVAYTDTGISGEYKFVITDVANLHLNGLTSAGDTTVNYVTQAEYEAIQAKPAEHRHENFEVEVSVESYEVDAAGKKLADVDGANSKQTISVDVKAVTDDVELKVKDSTQTDVTVAVAGDNKSATITFNEDDSINLTDILDPAAFKDTDGSEKRELVIEGLPKDAIVTVAGTKHTIGTDGKITIDDLPQTGGLPAITVQAPKNFSGNIEGVRVTLNAKDTDSDSSGTIAKKSAEVSLDLYVNPIAGDVTAEDVTTEEDTPVAFMQGIKLTDDNSDGGNERITKVEFEVPTGWKVIAPTITSDFSASLTGTKYTIEANGTYDLEDILKDFKITPPAHSSKDETITVKVTTEDSNTVNGPKVIHVQKNDLTIKVAVAPVAERVGTDSDGQNGNDVTMNGNHVFDTQGVEDEPFVLGTEADFRLSAGWSNEDGKWVRTGENWAKNTDDGRSEDTFALLTPYSRVDANGVHDAQHPGTQTGDKALDGSSFTYSDGTTTHTLPFAGEPVKIPMQYLDTVTFTGPKYWSGVVKMQVQAGTVDYDEDDGTATQLEVSGEAWLTNMIVAPRADQVTLKVDAITKTLEDEPVKLNINPTSSDTSETFDVTISGIPKGASIKYWSINESGTSVEKTFVAGADNSSLEITNFDKSNQPELTPPQDSNETINLSVKAESVDSMTYIDKDDKQVTIVQKGNSVTYLDQDGNVTSTETIAGTEPHELPIEVQVQGVPDEPTVTIAIDKEYFEDGSADQGSATGLKVTLSDLITKLKSGETGVDNAGPDGSETITLRITDLPEGFTLGNAGPKLGSGDGTDRIWVVSQADLTNATINVPKHFSGTVNLTIQPVVTENDNPSDTFFDKQNISFKVKPVTEATLSVSSELVEDTIGQINLEPVLHGDSDEFISQVRIAVSDLPTGVTLYTDAAGSTLATATGGYYVFDTTGTNKAPEVFVKGLANFSGSKNITLEYTVTDPSQDAAGLADRVVDVTSDWQTVEHKLTFAPVTDEIKLTLEETGISLDAGTGTGTVSHSIDGDIITTKLNNAGTLTLNLKIDQQADPNADSSVTDGKDIDGSEQLTHIVISGVPEGVSVVGAIETAKGQWLVKVPSTYWDAATNGTLGHQVEFEVSGYANAFTDQPINITTYSKDTGAVTYEKDTIEWKLTYAPTGPGDAVDLPEATLDAIDYTGTEDTSFALNEVMTGGVDSAGAGVDDYNITVTIRTAADDETTFTGMDSTQVVENGELVTLWTKTVEVAAGENGQDKLAAILADITINLPEHSNSNDFGANGKLELDVNLSVHTHGISQDAQAKTDIKITPVTDEINIEVSQNSVDEGEDIALNITLPTKQTDGNLGDTDAGWAVVDDLVYIHLADGDLKGQLTDSSGNALAVYTGSQPAETPTGGKVYAVNKDSLAGLKFVPDVANHPYQTGKLDVTVLVEHQEANSGASKVSTSTGSLNIHISNSGYNATVSAAGNESQGKVDDLIKLELGAEAGLNDSAESISAAFVSGLPSGFTVWTGASGSEKMANNAGGGTWAIPVEGGLLPTMHIKPPKNWSGTLSDLKLTVMSGHAGLEPTPTEIDFSLVVSPVADGLEMNPTLSFGDAGEKISLNLNASMKDPAKATGAEGDAYTELTELSLSGFPDGQKVLFYIGDSEIPLDEKVSFADGVWTVTGLSQDDLNNLKFIHGEGTADITVKGRTYEADSDGNPYQENGNTHYSDWSDSATAAINISPTVPSSGDDFFLWEGKSINGFGGEDTVQLRFGDKLTTTNFSKLENIETIDMAGYNSGENTITGLRIEDVISMTDDRNVLEILGDSEDKFTLGAGWTATGNTADGYVTYIQDGATLKIQDNVNIIID